MTTQHRAPSRDGVGFPLAGLAIMRLLVSDHVAAAKFGTYQPIDDPVREQGQLDRIRRDAIVAGADTDSAVSFFRDQIAASKIIQRGLFRLWAVHPCLAQVVRSELGTIRLHLDELTTRILREFRSTPVVAGLASDDDWSGGVIDHLESLHRQALDVALKSVRHCDTGDLT